MVDQETTPHTENQATLIADTILETGFNGKILSVNKDWEPLFGLTREKLTSVTIFDLVQEDSHSDIRAALRRAVAGASYVEFDGRVTDLKGQTKRLWWRGIKGNGKSRLKFSIIDISTREASARPTDTDKISEAALRTILNSVNEAIFVVDKSGGVVDVNDMTLEMFGVNFSEATRLSFIDDILEVENSGFKTDYWQNALTDDKSQIFCTKCKRRHTKVVFDCEIFLRKVRLRDEDFVLASIRDVTEQKQIENKLRELATTDDLTKIYNRRFFMEALKLEVERARRYCHKLSLLMIDADNFKSVNDNYGHNIGDEVLRVLAQIGKRSLRDVDVFGRLGGEEFAVVLPETGRGKAHTVAERLRQALESATIATELGPLHFTVSIGIASAAEELLDVNHLLKRADRALYKAKESGRNCVVLSEEDASSSSNDGFITKSGRPANQDLRELGSE